MIKTLKFALYAGVAVVGLILMAGLFGPKPSREASAPPSKAEQVVSQREPAPIENLAIAPYTSEDYPTTVAKFGKAIPAVNADRKKASKIAAQSTDCDSVQNVQVSTRSPMANRHYWVECGNLTRLYFDETSLAEGKSVETQTKAEWLANGLKEW